MSGVESPTLYVEEMPAGGGRLAHFPVTFFAVVMGLAGLSLAWTRAAGVLDAPAAVGEVLFWSSAGVYALVLVTYLAKIARHPVQVHEELAHPVRLAFVPTAAIALLLLATAAQPIDGHLSEVLWWIGIAAQFPITVYVVSAWINRPSFGPQHVTPAWFIPVVGSIVVPLAGVEHGSPEISWFFFAVGLLFWAALLPMVLTRLFVHDQPVPERLVPTLAVLVAPPAVAFLAYLRLEPHGLDPFARILYYGALFFLVLVIAQVGRLRRLPFFLSWWAYSFPAAAITAASEVFAAELGRPAWALALSWVLLVLATALVGVLAVRTAAEMARGTVCVPE